MVCLCFSKDCECFLVLFSNCFGHPAGALVVDFKGGVFQTFEHTNVTEYENVLKYIMSMSCQPLITGIVCFCCMELRQMSQEDVVSLF